MISYFAKRRMKRHDRNNNRKLKAMVHSTLLQQQALTGTATGVGNTAAHDLVVSLTSFDKRIGDLHLCIESLLQQSLRPDRILLWLSPADLPSGRVPELLKRQQARGLEIIIKQENLGSYHKIVHALEEYPESLVITVDDDILYPVDMVEGLYTAWLDQPEYIHCHRAHCMQLDGRGRPVKYRDWPTNRSGEGASLRVFPTGVCGVLYFPGALDAEVFNRDQFQRLCPGADDIWLKAMSLKQSTLCSRIEDCRDWKERFLTIEGSQSQALKHLNWMQRDGNDEKLKAVFTEYGLFEQLA